MAFLRKQHERTLSRLGSLFKIAQPYSYTLTQNYPFLCYPQILLVPGCLSNLSKFAPTPIWCLLSLSRLSNYDQISGQYGTDTPSDKWYTYQQKAKCLHERSSTGSGDKGNNRQHARAVAHDNCPDRRGCRTQNDRQGAENGAPKPPPQDF